MANATPIRIGQANLSADAMELFMKVFTGEVLTAFETQTVVADRHFVRQITHGKSASFPATWKVSGGYHAPGTEIVGQTSAVNERVIGIDDQLISSVFIPNIDEAMSHFDYRGIYSSECGNFLARSWDSNVMQVMAKAARASATVTGGYGGTQLTSTGTLYKTSATDLVNGLFLARQTLEEKDIPATETINAFMRPAQYYLLAQLKDLVDRDYTAGNGDTAKATVLKVAGINLVRSNMFPNTNVTSGPVAYRGDFSKTAAIVTTQNAVGTVKLRDIMTETDYDVRRQGNLIVAKYLIGHGILRPECAVELLTTT